MPAGSLIRYAWLSIAAALATILLKTVAWRLTGSVGLLSDALESVVNLAGAVMALAMLSVAARPADSGHAHGHDKAEYFSSGFEGFLILAAAVSIGYTAIERLLRPQPIEAVGVGLGVSLVASLINFATARALLVVARKHGSITLEADAHHLLTDVWTSVGVVVAVLLVALTGWLWLDPVIALLVAANIVWTGFQLLRRSISGLMDASLDRAELDAIEGVLAGYRAEQIGCRLSISCERRRADAARAAAFAAAGVGAGDGDTDAARGRSWVIGGGRHRCLESAADGRCPAVRRARARRGHRRAPKEASAGRPSGPRPLQRAHALAGTLAQKAGVLV
ncbi:MAG: cation diffusion facilitator family transporter [Minicystis sp.]